MVTGTQSKDRSANLRPYRPGQSGNPGGRPKMPGEIKARLAQLAPQVIERLAELTRSKNDSVAVAACRELLDRHLGKSVQRVDFVLEDARQLARAKAQQFGLDEDLAIAEAEAIFRGEVGS